MTESNEFDEIRPYNDDEAVAALKRVARHPYLPIISKYLFPNERFNSLSKSLNEIKSIDDFQNKVMMMVISAVLAKTADGFTCGGIENLKALEGKKFLAVSNHRDIVLDPSLIQYALHDAGIPYTKVCVGNNLLSDQLIEDLMRSNRMIKVIRGISARELYLSSQRLSKYIRESITSGECSIWIAQREGRTKNGIDTTEQGLLKMFDMSGTKDFTENFKELNIVPISISYEYEPCDLKKARELYIKEQNGGTYVKKKDEDLHSILSGIRQAKGHIHIEFGKPLSAKEISDASTCTGNDRYQAIRHRVDERIVGGYTLYKTNYMGYDLLESTDKYLGTKYLPEDLDAFKKYIDHKLGKLERDLDKNEVRRILLGIYANPVKNIYGELQ